MINVDKCCFIVAIFINVGRGDNVDENALVAALFDGQIGACCLDVFEKEPLPKDSPLWQFSDDKVVLSPVCFTAASAFMNCQQKDMNGIAV